MTLVSRDAFLLTRHWRDNTDGIALEFWLASETGPLQVLVSGQEAVFFVAAAAEQHLQRLLAKAAFSGQWRLGEKTFRNYLGEAVQPLYFRQYRQAREAWRLLEGAGISVWEADIKPTDRFLMERFITGGVSAQGVETSNTRFSRLENPHLKSSDYQPRLKVISLDIETSMDAKELYSIGVYGNDVAVVFMVGGECWRDDSSAGCLEVVACATQRICLQRFFQWLEQNDPDILIGWNVVQFDLAVLEALCRAQQLSFVLGRNKQAVYVRKDSDGGRLYMDVPGRMVLDGIDLLKAAAYNFVSYSLENVSQQLLGEGKLLHGDQRGEDIAELFKTDKAQLARYNINDCRLAWEVFAEVKLLEFALARSQLTGLSLDRMGGSVAAFEYAYLPLLHRKGYVAPSLGELRSDIVSPGGYVLDSRPGIYKNVLVLDFKSLYPSIIRTFCIDPYGFWVAEQNQIEDEHVVPGYNGAIFSKHDNLLPDIIEKLWAARDEAKAAKDQPLSQAIKIIMNSFYGVLGSVGCRFFDPRVCSSITLRGHDILQQTKAWIEAAGHEVIYGDTDSVFVWVGDDTAESLARDIGTELAVQLNRQWREKIAADYSIESALELEFETHYLTFLMPTIRGSSAGSKKRYAGIVRAGDQEKMVFKGLENVRTDWTALAKEFQQQLYERVFSGEPVEEFVRQRVEQVLAGELDEQLLYRKRLRQKLQDYQKNIPPHVKAARLLAQRGEVLRRGDWVTYYMTVHGPEPEQWRQSPLDYHHYIDKQLAPVADSILQFVGLSFAELVAPQGQLFDDAPLRLSP